MAGSSPPTTRLAPEIREFAAGLSPEIGPMFGRDVQRLCDEAEAQASRLDEFRDLLIELARWSRVAEKNGDLHARIASALACDEIGRESSAAADAVGERQGRQPARERTGLHADWCAGKSGGDCTCHEWRGETL